MKQLSLTLVALILCSPMVHAQMVLRIDDPAGVGFNDMTPAAPQPGNPATTVGQQRVAVLQRALDIWNAELRATHPIVVAARHTAQTCTATRTVLASAIPGTAVNSDEVYAGEYVFPIALANEMFNPSGIGWEDLNGSDPEILVNVNSNLGTATCGVDLWTGLDRTALPAALASRKTPLLPVLLHELAHGLGFVSFSSQYGPLYGLPSFFSYWATDRSTDRKLSEMNIAQHARAVVNDPNLFWGGKFLQLAIQNFGQDLLFRGRELRVGRVGVPLSMPLRRFDYVRAEFGSDPVLGREALVVQVLNTAPDFGSSTTDGCTAIINAAEVRGRIALLDRGHCPFTTKALNAQNAGAVAAWIANNEPGVVRPGGMDPTITIPVLGVSQEGGQAINTLLAGGMLQGSAMQADGYLGFADSGLRLYAPATFAQGSSVSHFTNDAGGLLMQPAISPNLFDQLDVTPYLLWDLGWR
jgi:PA domain